MQLDGFVEVSEVLRSGVYALVNRGVVIYVGKSKSMYQRIYAHRTIANRAKRGHKIPSWLPAKGFVFDQVFVRPCSVDSLDAVEVEMVNLYKPRFNESLKNGLKVRAPIPLKIGGVEVMLNRPTPAPPISEIRRI